MIAEANYGISAIDRSLLRNKYLAMSSMEFAGVLCDSYKLKLPPARSTLSPRSPVLNVAAGGSLAAVQVDVRRRMKSAGCAIAPKRTAQRNTKLFTAQQCVISATARPCYYLEADGGGGCCPILDNESQPSRRSDRITLAPVVALCPITG